MFCTPFKVQMYFQISMSVCSSLVQMEELASIFKDHTSVDVLKAGLDKTVK